MLHLWSCTLYSKYLISSLLPRFSFQKYYLLQARGKLNDQKNRQELVDPRLLGRVSVDVLSMVLAVAKKCIAEDDVHRPEIQGVIEGLLDVISKSRDHKASSSSSSTHCHGV